MGTLGWIFIAFLLFVAVIYYAVCVEKYFNYSVWSVLPCVSGGFLPLVIIWALLLTEDPHPYPFTHPVIVIPMIFALTGLIGTIYSNIKAKLPILVILVNVIVQPIAGAMYIIVVAGFIQFIGQMIAKITK